MRIGTMRIGTVSALVITVGLLAGCGSSSTPPAKSTHSEEKQSEKSKMPATSSSEETSSTEESSNTATTSSSETTTGSEAASFTSNENCLQLAGVGTKLAEAASSLTGQGKTLDLTKFKEGYEELEEKAPEEIKPDVATIATAFTTFAGALEEAHYKIGEVPSASQQAALLKASEAFNNSEVKKASTAISEWAAKNCGVPSH